MPGLTYRPVSGRLFAALALLVSLAALACAGPAAAKTRAPVFTGTFYVDGASTGGPCSDSYTAVQAESPTTPWCTISNAVTLVGTGSTIRVAPGIYHEEVTLSPADDGVTLEGVGASKPVIEGDNVRSVGIQLVNGVHNVTLTGFEVRDLVAGPTAQAIGIVSYNTYDDTIANNVVHAVHSAGAYSTGILLGWNGSPGLVHNVTVSGNRVYDIGPGGESMGIWLMMATDMNVTGNEVYLVRKEGIRDWCGLDNSFTSNRMYLNWIGITLESAVGDYVANNVAYANDWGYDPKHVNEASSLTMWGLSAPQWVKFWHNTSYGETHADIALGMNTPDEDYIDVRDNVFANPGDVHLHDFPDVRGPDIIMDGNVYSGSAPVYYTGWNNPHSSVYSTLAQLQSALGWEAHGQAVTLQFADPTTGNFAFRSSGMAPGVTLPDSYGAQLGAVGVPPATMAWTRYAARVVATTAEPSYLSSLGAGDGRDDTYWWSASTPNGAVTFDLGAPEPMNTFVLDLMGQLDPRNPQGYSIQVSNDDVNWTTVLSGNNPDSEGSSYKYTLATAVTARYVRLNLLSSFGAGTVIFDDFDIGLLSAAGQSASIPVPNPAAPRHAARRRTSHRHRRHKARHRRSTRRRAARRHPAR